MKYLNFSTVEELVFKNQELQKLLPANMFNYFEQWKLGHMVPMLRQISKQAMLDFLDQLSDDHIQIIEEFYGEEILLEKLKYKLVENYKIPIDEEVICDQLCSIEFKYFTTWRDESYLYISFWR